MKILFLFIFIVVFFLITLYIWNNFQRKKGITEESEKGTKEHATDGECCGQHAVCEKDSLINSFMEQAEYFDDEELDRFSGKPSDDYTEKNIEEFREIFYSIFDEDKPKWIRSLQQRGIAVPDQLKDEIILFINELRNSK